MKIQTTTVTQTANEVLGAKEKNLYYLIIENVKGTKLVVNVGQKTHDTVMELVKEEEKFRETERELKAKHEAEQNQIDMKTIEGFDKAKIQKK